jgi:hypothetical protein
MKKTPSLFLSLLLPVLAAAPFASCAATGAEPAGAPAAAQEGAADGKGEAKGDAKQDAAKKEEAAKRKKQRDFEYAQLALEAATMDSENERRATSNAIEAAERELKAAKNEQEHFKKKVVPLELDERALAVDRAKQNVLEAREELTELEAMYAQEDFAKATKELVMTRGRSRLAMSERDLGLAERRATMVKEFDHKKREREFADRVKKAENALEDAQARAAKVDVDKRLAVLKAEHALEDAKRELGDAAPAAAETANLSSGM